MKNKEKEWFNFTIQFVDKLDQHQGDWNSLNETEQELAALWKLEMDMHNGGFMQFFTNWGIDCYKIAVRCLEKLKAQKPLALIQSSYNLIDKYKEDDRLISYQDLYKIISEEEIQKIEELDQQYWELPDDIVTLTFETYKF